MRAGAGGIRRPLPWNRPCFLCFDADGCETGRASVLERTCSVNPKGFRLGTRSHWVDKTRTEKVSSVPMFRNIIL